MKILKFGGTSVGKSERMHHIAQLIQQEKDPIIVVLSAVSGTTNSLVEISNALLTNQKQEALDKINTLHGSYQDFIKHLYHSSESLVKGEAIIQKHFQALETFAHNPFTHVEERQVLAKGELISTQLFYTYLQELQIEAALLPALEFMHIDADGEPLLEIIETKLKEKLTPYPNIKIFITQGYICTNHKNEVDNLKRGGSDYSASLIGAAIRASEIQIWTDIDGMHNNDPRIVKNTFPIAELSFEEAAELAYFGAKILHPATIHPAQKYNIPVRLLNTMQPDAKGTLITNTLQTNVADIKAIAAKDGITAIKVKSSRMLLAYGFLRKIFEVFEKYKTPIDMITTSEVAVSLTIDHANHLSEITQELETFGNVEIDKDQTIICIVGSFEAEKQGIVSNIFDALTEIPIRMISYGGSCHNISLLVETQYKTQALNALNEGLFVSIKA